jgi:SPP1 family predicted phage head-tail adaptor
MNELAWFPTISTIVDELGQEDEQEIFDNQVFCEKKSVPQNEFFQAGQNDIKASCVLIVHTLEYQGQEKVKFQDKIYSIYRTYERNDDKTELYCEVRSGG